MHRDSMPCSWTSAGDYSGVSSLQLLSLPTLTILGTYSLDRQICVYLGRPFSLPEESIRTPYPVEVDDEAIKTLDNDQIANLESSIAFSKKKSSKSIANSIFALRRLQSEMQTVLYQSGELPRAFENLAHWKKDMQSRLSKWYDDVPKSQEEAQCRFNFDFIELNYHQSRLLLYGLSPASAYPDDTAFLIIEDAAKHIFRAYRRLQKADSINYTWLSCHNLFMAGTSPLP